MANKAKASAQSRKARAAAITAAQQRRQRSLTLTIGAIVAVVVVVLGLLVAKSLIKDTKTPASETSGLLAGAVLKQLEVPLSVSNKIGAGQIQTPPKAIKGAPPLTADGKPRVVYAGSEFCPYCAAERWAMAVALDRFGSFRNLGQSASSDTDVFPGTKTLSFHGSSYSSTFLSFTGYELENRDQTKKLDTLSKADAKLMATYDAPPYVDASAKGTIPFVDIGGKYLISGASFDPGVLKGMTHAQIGKALSDPNSKVAQSIVGTANVVTAALCELTNGQPGNVCTSPGVTAAAKQLG